MPVRTLNWTIHNFLVNRGNEINKCKEDITKLKEHIDSLSFIEELSDRIYSELNIENIIMKVFILITH